MAGAEPELTNYSVLFLLVFSSRHIVSSAHSASSSSTRRPSQSLFAFFLRHGNYMVWSYKITALLKNIIFVGAQLPPYSFHSQHRPHGNSREQKLDGGS